MFAVKFDVVGQIISKLIVLASFLTTLHKLEKK